MYVERPEVVEEEAVDVGERRRVSVASVAVVVVGGGGLVDVQRRGPREPARGEEPPAGDVRWNGRAGDVNRRDLLELPGNAELQGFAQLGSLPIIFHLLSSL